MKQTNNAIKFLMAQYRAIFKNAYFKGMATALVLTAGLAAGQAQAAHDGSFYESSDKNNFTEKTEAISSGYTQYTFGGYETDTDAHDKATNGLDGVVNGATLSFGGSGDDVVQGTASGAFAGYVNLSGSANNAIATNNKLQINGTVTFGGTNAHAVGGWAVHKGNGTATAQGNEVHINANASTATTKGNATINGQIIGAWASSLNGAAALDNIVEINGSGATAKMALQNSVFGGLAAAEDDAKSGTFRAQGNQLTITDASLTKSGSMIMGGYVNALDSGSVNDFNAANNIVTLNNVTVSGSSSASNIVAANYADAQKADLTINSVTANGTEGQTSLTIHGGDYTYTDILGGYAATSGDTGIEVSANFNSVLMDKGATITSGGVYGARIISNSSDKVTITGSNNSISIAANDAKTIKNHAHNNIYGSFVSGTFSTNGSGSTITANNNKVTVGDFNTFNLDSNSSGSNFAGAYIVTDKSGAAITASNNTVEVYADVVGYQDGDDVKAGLIAGAVALDKGHVIMNNNKVTVGGKVTDGLVAGAYSTTDNIKMGTSNERVVPTMTGNSVTITADAELLNTDIYAVYSKADSSGSTVMATNNDVTVSGKVTNSHIYGGMGADSVITLDSSSKYIANDSTTASPYNIQSDVVNVAGELRILNGNAVTIKGYAANGSLGDDEVDTNSTTIASSAKVFNYGTLTLRGETDVQDGATLAALNTNANIVVDASNIKTKVDPKANPNPDLDYKLTGGTAALVISDDLLSSYLNPAAGSKVTIDNQEHDVTKGSLYVTKLGAVDFRDSVVLSNFDFANSQTPGKIQIDSNAYNETNGSGAIFRADTVTIEHKLAQNATTYDGQHKNLVDVTTAGVAIEADVLNLGSSNLTSSQSAEIGFAQAKVKDTINFIARTSGEDVNGDGTPNTGVINNGYHLTTTVIGSNYMLTNDQDAAKEYYTSLAGDINGVVTVQDTGKLHIQDGDWTANDIVTVTSGGSILVGGDTGVKDKLESVNGYVREPDATLSLAAGLVLDVTNGGNAATVTADGDRYSVYDRPEMDDFYGDNRYVELDLTNGVEMKTDNGTITGKAEINATNGGVVLLNASDVNDILAQNHAWNDKTGGTNNNHSGAFFKASAGGELRVDGDITAQFRDFDGSGDTNGFDLSGTKYPAGNGNNTNVIDADTSGRLVADSLTIVNPHSGTVLDDADYIATAKAVHLGGAVLVKDLEINDLQQTNGDDKPAGTNTYASQVTIADGGAQISHSLTSFNDKLILGQEGTSSAILYFETDAVADEGTISVNKIELASGSEIDFANGTWDASATDFNLSGAGSKMIVGNDYDYDINDNPYSATLKADDLTMGADTTLIVDANGTASFNGANLKDLTADNGGILVEGYLTINGTAISDTNKNGGVTFGEAGSIRIANNGTLNFGNAAVNGAIVADGQHTGDTVTLREGYTKIANQGGTLRLDLADSTTFSADAIQSLKDQLFTSNSFNSDGILADGGLLNIGKANFEGFTGYDTVDDPAKGLHGYTATWDEVKDFSDIFSEDVTNDMNSTANITGIEPGDEVKGAWGSLSMVPNVPTTAQVTLAGNTTLSYAEGNNGFFISDNDHKIALGAIVEAQKTFNLVNGGSIGKVTLTNGKDNANDDRNLTTLNINGNGNLTTINGIDTVISNNTTAYATRVNVNSDADVTGDITGVGRVNVNEGATLHVYNPDASSKDVPEVLVNTLAVRNGNAQIDGDLIIDGQYSSDRSHEGFGGEGEAYAVGGTITATNIELEHNADLTTVHGGLISAETVTAVADTNGQSDSLITVGQDLDYETWDDTEDAAYTGTGYLEISKYLDLNGGTLMVDPVYGEATSVAAVMNFKDGSDKTWDSVKNDVGIVDGRALIGKNAALGIGATLEETRAAIADFQENGSLSQEKYGSILYLNGQLTIANGSEIALNADPVTADVDGIRRALKYTITSNQLDQFATLGLGANTAILMSEAAFEDADGKKTQTAIHFDRESAVINANGGEIVLIGAFDTSEKLNFFSDNDSGNNNGVDIVNASGADGTIKVYTQNGFLFATLTGKNQGQGVQLHVDQDKAFSVMNQASYPVVETLISYHEDRIAQDTTTTPETPAPEAGEDNQSGSSSIPAEKILTQSELASRTSEQETRETIPAVPIVPQEPNTPEANTRVTGSSDFLNEVVTKSHGAPAEAAARLAIYGGAVQAAMAATSSTTDAIAARMGVGDTAAITMANNGQGAALWLAPVYKTHDSDSFDSQGLDYGVDLNLYGVALGADFEFMPGLTAGIMFNVGSGDADGQGNAAANNTSNDFDYWGAALYGNYTYDALSVTADVSYTAVDNDLEATTGMQQYSKLESSTDTTAISLGVTAKYTFDFGGVEVAPHAGLRYTNIDLDDYSIKSNGESIADYSADKVNIFSIPVGVTFAKEFTGEAWTVKPSLDLTLTGNFGDDDISGDVSWTGVDGLVTPVSSEYMDDFTYGATLGIEAASTGGFSLGLGVNYTGSSNVDEFGVNANARFVF